MRGALIGAVIALTFALTWSLAKVPTLEDRVSTLDEGNANLSRSVDDLRGQVGANAEALADANAKLIALGKAPVPVPSPRPSPEPQPQGLTASQLEAVRAVVVDELGSHNAKVSQATINQITQAAGTLATQNITAGLPASVKAAVAAYCVDDKCVGKPGETGKPGQNGRDGEDGADAPAVTDEQLLAAAQQALAAYCGQEAKPCQGPAGKDGENGKDAPPPYSVIDQDCVGDGDRSVWKIYLSNGTEQKTVEAAGPCRIGPDPN
jgi:hypothetical protein